VTATATNDAVPSANTRPSTRRWRQRHARLVFGRVMTVDVPNVVGLPAGRGETVLPLPQCRRNRRSAAFGARVSAKQTKNGQDATRSSKVRKRRGSSHGKRWMAPARYSVGCRTTAPLPHDARGTDEGTTAFTKTHRGTPRPPLVAASTRFRSRVGLFTPVLPVPTTPPRSPSRVRSWKVACSF